MSLKGYIITDSYTITDFETEFDSLFPEFDSVDVTTSLLDVACDILPEGMTDYLSVDTVKRCVFYTVAHLCAYFDMLNASTSVKSVLRNAASMSATSLSISYSEIAKLKGELFSSLNDFLFSTAYGRLASIYLEKLVGSAGGYVI